MKLNMEKGSPYTAKQVTNRTWGEEEEGNHEDWVGKRSYL